MPLKVTLQYEGESYDVVVAGVDRHTRGEAVSYSLRGTDPYCYPEPLQEVLKFFSGGMAAGPDGVDETRWPAAHVGPDDPVTVVGQAETNEPVPEPNPPSF